MTAGVRSPLCAAPSVVVKIGTAVLTGETAHLDRGYLHDMASVVAGLIGGGRRVTLVSSGAVAAGLGVLGLSERPTTVAELQAAAAVGQPELMRCWREAFDVRGIAVAQVLIGRGDFDARDRFLNIRNCLHSLHGSGVVPIVNENDTVATDEISLGDNDVLAAKLASAAQAEALVMLTGVPGVLDECGVVIDSVLDPERLRGVVRAGRSSQGRGGLGTKLDAARLGSLSGVVVVIGPGRPAGALRRILLGERVGTVVSPADAGHAGRRRWIALAATAVGAVTVDSGAARAVRERGASLLAKGVVGVTGRFGVGDVVAIRDETGSEVGRGLTNLSGDELRIVQGQPSSSFAELLGRRAHAEVVHRDNLVLTERREAGGVG